MTPDLNSPHEAQTTSDTVVVWLDSSLDDTDRAKVEAVVKRAVQLATLRDASHDWAFAPAAEVFPYDAVKPCHEEHPYRWPAAPHRPYTVQGRCNQHTLRPAQKASDYG